MKISGAEDTITVASGEEMRQTNIFKLLVTQHFKNGQKVQRLVMNSVTVTPHGSYNLFSVTKSMEYIACYNKGK